MTSACLGLSQADFSINHKIAYLIPKRPIFAHKKFSTNFSESLEIVYLDPKMLILDKNFTTILGCFFRSARHNQAL